MCSNEKSYLVNTAFTSLQTPRALLYSYESLALAHEKALKLAEISAEQTTQEINQDVNYQNAFALLIINAAIIEGTLRSILSMKMLEDLESIQTAMGSNDALFLAKAKDFLFKYREEVETQGGWENLKKQYSFYLSLSLDGLMGDELKEAIDVLFTLRNILAHGTAIVAPQSKMNKSEKELYPYVWQRKLQGATVYLNKEFKGEDIFANLKKHEVPEHFMKKTQALFTKLEQELSPMPANTKKTIDMIKKYDFGYVYFTR